MCLDPDTVPEAVRESGPVAGLFDHSPRSKVDVRRRTAVDHLRDRGRLRLEHRVPDAKLALHVGRKGMLEAGGVVGKEERPADVRGQAVEVRSDVNEDHVPGSENPRARRTVRLCEGFD